VLLEDASMLPIGVFGANLFVQWRCRVVQWRCRAVLLVIGEDLAFAWRRPILSRLDPFIADMLEVIIEDGYVAYAFFHDLGGDGGQSASPFPANRKMF
jgi:hypothetical protein